MTRGIIFVRSRLSLPSAESANSAPRLTPEKFCAWYEETHIPDVVALSGVGGAGRWAGLGYDAEKKTGGEGGGEEKEWATVYEMPDLGFRESEEFKGLDGQSKPTQDILEEIFRQSIFETRFYEETQLFEPHGPPAQPAKFLISASLDPAQGGEAEFDNWYRTEHLDILSRVPGFVRSRRYEVVQASVLDQFERKSADAPKYLALHEFSGELPWSELRASGETEWAKKVLGGLTKEEVGVWGWVKGFT
ncbi:hypothetical protein BS50DRAFT_681867 [Corynespora cassiicola Philippines]|uniref:EthD domain-containing protein n=1 Tax=Corynespora cassiicola Philippines TaxID=1448308 RepID=A0A2T2N3M0_CORCC|nr:hypothetical protein BS50DRAFT_681867 [Corynespora cassiicola Philippines]